MGRRTSSVRRGRSGAIKRRQRQRTYRGKAALALKLSKGNYGNAITDVLPFTTIETQMTGNFITQDLSTTTTALMGATAAASNLTYREYKVKRIRVQVVPTSTSQGSTFILGSALSVPLQDRIAFVPKTSPYDTIPASWTDAQEMPGFREFNPLKPFMIDVIPSYLQNMVVSSSVPVSAMTRLSTWFPVQLTNMQNEIGWLIFQEPTTMTGYSSMVTNKYQITYMADFLYRRMKI